MPGLPLHLHRGLAAERHPDQGCFSSHYCYYKASYKDQAPPVVLILAADGSFAGETALRTGACTCLEPHSPQNFAPASMGAPHIRWTNRKLPFPLHRRYHPNIANDELAYLAQPELAVFYRFIELI
ncbi:MAG: hypothetical protein C5B53_13730 [Candidatus Melainabacteria bacterium]|nr:MAG: hypothetical protein C5B53_13730 [Candidatus Melainabacteria bacterium]